MIFENLKIRLIVECYEVDFRYCYEFEIVID